MAAVDSGEGRIHGYRQRSTEYPQPTYKHQLLEESNRHSSYQLLTDYGPAQWGMLLTTSYDSHGTNQPGPHQRHESGGEASRGDAPDGAGRPARASEERQRGD